MGSTSAGKTWSADRIRPRMKTLRRLAVATLCYWSAAYAVDWKALKPQGYVSDFANVVDASSRAALERYCARVEQLTQAQMALVTIATLEGEPIEDVTNTIYRAWGVGQNSAKALYWFNQAANNGHRLAAKSLAHIYEKGLMGVAPDAKLAEEWRTRADALKH